MGNSSIYILNEKTYGRYKKECDRVDETDGADGTDRMNNTEADPHSRLYCRNGCGLEFVPGDGVVIRRCSGKAVRYCPPCAIEISVVLRSEVEAALGSDPYKWLVGKEERLKKLEELNQRRIRHALGTHYTF